MANASNFKVCKYCALDNTVGDCCKSEFMKARNIKRSFTFGVMPLRVDFQDMFASVNGGEEYMSIMGCEYNVSDLYENLETWANMGEEESAQLASVMMEKLGFEWILGSEFWGYSPMSSI